MVWRQRPRRMLLPAALLAAACYGQQEYFGQNQVRYDRFDFKILTTEHFDVYFYDEERVAAEHAARMAERWYARLSRLLNHEFEERKPLILYASHPHFQQTGVLGGAPGEGTGGATEVLKNRIVLPFAGPLKETDHVIGHEIVHAFQFDMTGKGGTLTNTNIPRALFLPLWFIEGMAEYLSVGPVDPHTAMWMRDAAANDRLPTMRQLENPRYFPYRFGQAFWAYVAGRFGDEVVGRILNAAARAGGAEQAVQAVLRIPVDTLNAEWRDAIRYSYRSLEEESTPPSAIAHQLTKPDERFGFNLGPALSPDGREIAFFTVVDFISIELFRADAETGEIQERIVGRSTDSHLESLGFINSAGAWAPDGDRFAFAGVVASDPVLSVRNVRTAQTEVERTFPELGEILNPTWSPDGRRLAFTAVVGGLSDLFIYDLETDSLRRLTNDPYADMQPSWSPDGNRIAFVSDRFSTDIGRLRYGTYNITLVDVATARIVPGPGFSGAKNINPQWAPDGESLYFLSDRTGVTNVYRADVATSRVFQVTDLYTGATGITALSPALTSAASTDKIALTVYEKGSYNVYTIDSLSVLRGTAVLP